jgi:hypothetical protein
VPVSVPVEERYPKLLPAPANGEYLPEPPDAKTVSCDGLSSGLIRYDQLSYADGFRVLSAMAAVALELNDDLKAKLTVTEEAEAKFGIHLAFRFMPGIELYRHVFNQHNGERDFRLAECKGIEELVKKLGIPPATVRTWRQRYRHLPEYRAALEANGIPIETKPERIKKCDSCGTRINLPEGQEPDHDENCPEHPMRREAMDVIRDLAVRGETYKRIACGEGKYAMLPEKSRIQKIQELAQGTPVSDVVELDDFSVLLNRIREQETDEMLSMVNGYYDPQRERLSILEIDLVIGENSGAPATGSRNGNIQSTAEGLQQALDEGKLFDPAPSVLASPALMSPPPIDIDNPDHGTEKETQQQSSADTPAPKQSASASPSLPMPGDWSGLVSSVNSMCGDHLKALLNGLEPQVMADVFGKLVRRLAQMYCLSQSGEALELKVTVEHVQRKAPKSVIELNSEFGAWSR